MKYGRITQGNYRDKSVVINSIEDIKEIKTLNKPKLSWFQKLKRFFRRMFNK